MAIDGNSLDDGEELAHRSGAPIGSVGLVLGRAFLDSPEGATERLENREICYQYPTSSARNLTDTRTSVLLIVPS